MPTLEEIMAAGQMPTQQAPQQSRRQRIGQTMSDIGLGLIAGGDERFTGIAHGIQMGRQRKTAAEEQRRADANDRFKRGLGMMELNKTDAPEWKKGFDDEGREVYGTYAGGRFMPQTGSKPAPPPKTPTMKPVYNAEAGETRYQAVGSGNVEGGLIPPKSGMSITTNPDGTTSIQMGGDDGNMQKGTRAKLEKSLIDSRGTLAELQMVKNKFKPEFQTIGHKLGIKALEWSEKMGNDLTPEQQGSVAEYETFFRDSISGINNYIRSITGAQLSQHEADRIMGGMPNPGDSIFNGNSPTQFKAKLDSAMKMLRQATARAHYTLRNNLQVSEIGLHDMESIISDRGNEIADAYVARGWSEEDAFAQSKKEVSLEFGM